jgi:hypothetical protein
VSESPALDPELIALLERARDRAPEQNREWYPTLPTSDTVPVVHLTLDQLHDVVYAAASTYLHTLSSMGQDRARQHAERIAHTAEQVVRAEGHVEPGQPR